jgi:hypothetical protein
MRDVQPQDLGGVADDPIDIPGVDLNVPERVNQMRHSFSS